MSYTRKMTEIETAAITLATDEGAIHPLLNWWMDEIANDPKFTLTIDEFAKTLTETQRNALANWPQPSGDYPARDWQSLFLNRQAHTAQERAAAPYDRAVFALLTAVVYYRRERIKSRAARTAAVATMETRLRTGHTIQTTLAAAVVEFHQRILNLKLNACEDNC